MKRFTMTLMLAGLALALALPALAEEAPPCRAEAACSAKAACPEAAADKDQA